MAQAVNNIDQDRTVAIISMDQHREMLKKVHDELLLVIVHIENQRVKKYLRWRAERDHEESQKELQNQFHAASYMELVLKPPPPPRPFFADYDEFLQ